MKGRKPLPTGVKDTKGTLRNSRINATEPLAEPLAELPAAPDWLNQWAKDEWYTVVAWLHSTGLLSSVDVSIVAAYCQQMGTFRQAEERMQGERVIVTEKGYEMPSPWVAIGNKALMQGLKIAAEYGFTPSSRSRINAPGHARPRPNKPESKLKQLMAKRAERGGL